MKQQHEKKNLSTEAHFTLEYMHHTAAKSANVVIRNYKQKMKVTHFDGGDDSVNDNGEILNLHLGFVGENGVLEKKDCA